jgi:molybdate transport system substrate-binding protein
MFVSFIMATHVLLTIAAQTVLTVFAAASLHAAFPEIGKQFEAAHPGVSVRFNFNGSQILEAQLAQGAQSDVFASADQRWMDKATSDGIVLAAKPFASNALVVVVSPASHVNALADLAKPGVQLVLCAEAVPCGRYARIMLGKMEADPKYGSGFAAAVAHNVVSEEEDVEAVLAKVGLGEADAGIVYRSDVVASTAHLRVLDPPQAAQPFVSYPIAPVKSSASAALALEFCSFVLSSDGQATLRRFGFAPAPAPTPTPAAAH